MGETRAAAAQPLIDVTWTGTFADGNTAQTAPNDDGRFAAATAAQAVALDRDAAGEKAVEETVRYGAAAGIEAQVMSWMEAVTVAAAGDAPTAFANNAAQLTAVPTGATASDNAYVAQFKAALENDEIAVASALLSAIDTDGTTGLSDAEIVAYLQTDDEDTRTLLRNILAQGLSEKEKAVLVAVAAGNTATLTTALDDTDAAFSDDYKTAVRGLLDRYNVGNVRVAMNGGAINSRGDGIRAYYATPHDDNGAISVAVADGATVTGGEAGIWVANAGLDAGEDADSTADDILKQTVTVDGMVTGGADAGVHLVGGGRLTVGATGKVYAGSSGVGVRVNEPGRSIIRIDGEVRGRAGGRAAVDVTGGGMVTVGPTGSVNANGADNAVFAAGGATEVFLAYGEGQVDGQGPYRDHVQRQMTGSIKGGGIGGVFYAAANGGNLNGMRSRDPAPLNRNGTLNLSNLNCSPGLAVVDGQCVMPPPDEQQRDESRQGEQQQGEQQPGGQQPGEQQPGGQQPGGQQPMTPPPPTMTMDCGLASDDRCRLYEALPSALLAMNGLPTYAERASAARDARGGWARVETASGQWKAEDSTRPNVAYDHSRHGVRAGVDFLADETGRLGLSVHNVRGSAEMASVGEVEMAGSGVGVHATTFAGGFHVDVQAAMTWYDVDLKSALFGRLKDGVNGRGYAAGVEAGRRVATAADGVFLTPRAGLSWSKVALDAFTEEMTAGARVSVDDAESLKGRAGVAAEAGGAGGRLFVSVDAEHEFSAETEAKISGTALKATAEKTRFRFALGGDVGWGGGRYALRGVMSYAAGDGDNRDFGAGVNLAVRF